MIRDYRYHRLILRDYAAGLELLFRLCSLKLISEVAALKPDVRKEILVADLIEDQLRLASGPIRTSLGGVGFEDYGGMPVGASYL